MSIIIIFNCVAMAVERPAIEEGSQEADVLASLDIAFTVIFAVEALLKITVFSFKWATGRGRAAPDACVCFRGCMLLHACRGQRRLSWR
jgi:hypothetical protein